MTDTQTNPGDSLHDLASLLRDFAQARNWEQFFKAVDAVKVRLAMTHLDVRGDSGQAELAGVYVFQDPGTHRAREDSVSLHSTLRRDGTGWRIEGVR